MSLRKRIKKEIELFKAGGALPKERDVKHGMSAAEDQETEEQIEEIEAFGGPISSLEPSKLSLFCRWMLRELPLLPPDEQELFYLCFTKKLSQGALATYFKTTQQTVSNRIKRMKKTIADYIGVKI